MLKEFEVDSVKLFFFMVVFKRSIPLVVIYLLTGEWVAGSAGMGFTPHIITIPVGEVRNGTFALVFNMQSVEFFFETIQFFYHAAQ